MAACDWAAGSSNSNGSSMPSAALRGYGGRLDSIGRRRQLGWQGHAEPAVRAGDCLAGRRILHLKLPATMGARKLKQGHAILVPERFGGAIAPAW